MAPSMPSGMTKSQTNAMSSYLRIDAEAIA